MGTGHSSDTSALVLPNQPRLAPTLTAIRPAYEQRCASLRPSGTRTSRGAAAPAPCESDARGLYCCARDMAVARGEGARERAGGDEVWHHAAR